MKIAYNGFLYEAVSTTPRIWYHGTKVDFKSFEYQYAYLENSNAQYGPGFYLTDNIETAKGYAGSNGFVKEIKLKRIGMIYKGTRKYSPNMIRGYTANMPDKEMTLSDWDENPNTAMMKLRTSFEENNDNILELVQSIWIDCWKGHEAELVERLSKHSGIDGLLVPMGKETYLVGYNPNILQIVNTIKMSDITN